MSEKSGINEWPKNIQYTNSCKNCKIPEGLYDTDFLAVRCTIVRLELDSGMQNLEMVVALTFGGKIFAQWRNQAKNGALYTFSKSRLKEREI